jgi:hypothetical protein
MSTPLPLTSAQADAMQTTPYRRNATLSYRQAQGIAAQPTKPLK